jgi:hypothetical protein
MYVCVCVYVWNVCTYVSNIYIYVCMYVWVKFIISLNTSDCLLCNYPSPIAVYAARLSFEA